MTTEPVPVDRQNKPLDSSLLDVQEQSFLPQMLRFQIIPSTYSLLPLKQFAEVLKIPLGQIVPIPHMPPYVMGVYNWRGAVLWTIDLGHLLGMAPYRQYQQARSVHTTLVIEQQNEASGVQQLGLVIHDVVDTLEFDSSVITSTDLTDLPETLTQFLLGCWVDKQGAILTILDDQSIFEYMPNEQTYEV
ncbi:MAG: chemotaxis protein CheW [Symploca sp. SIO2B6]|nr:chemotaxis protein CheW [Symploca sp. SIO2B6]